MQLLILFVKSVLKHHFENFKKIHDCSILFYFSLVRLSIIWKSDLSNKIKWDSFKAVSILLYRCTSWTLWKRWEKKENGNVRRCFEQILETTAIQPLTSYLKKTNKICGKLLVKWKQTHKRSSSMDPQTWTCQC